jgi:hypothetical protein
MQAAGLGSVFWILGMNFCVGRDSGVMVIVDSTYCSPHLASPCLTFCCSRKSFQAFTAVPCMTNCKIVELDVLWRECRSPARAYDVSSSEAEMCRVATHFDQPRQFGVDTRRSARES